MFPINRAATTLIFKHRFPDVSLLALLVSVQAIEFASVVLNYSASSERQTEPVVRYVGDIHLAYMPVLALSAHGARRGAPGLGDRWSRRSSAAGCDRCRRDTLAPRARSADAQRRHRVGAVPRRAKIRNISVWPMGAGVTFVVELAYGLACWWMFRGGRALLAIVVGFNVANISEFFARDTRS